MSLAKGGFVLYSIPADKRFSPGNMKHSLFIENPAVGLLQTAMVLY
jgi:hypothetical protein